MLFILVFILSGCSILRSSKLLLPNWFDFTEIAAEVYVDEAMPADRRQALLTELALAQARVAGFFGERVGQPRLFACSTEDCFLANGGVSAKGKAYGASMLLLSPRGLNTVIISHEFSHIELNERLGVFKTLRVIPRWFDEGLAVLVSEDPRYSREIWRQAKQDGLELLETPAAGEIAWGEGNWLQTYGTARHWVGDWYARVGPDGLQRFIRDLNEGVSFQTAFKQAAAVPETRLPTDPT